MFLAIIALFVPSSSVYGQIPGTVYVWSMGNADQNAMMASVAGIVNRTSGEVLLAPANYHSLPSPTFWLDQLKAAYPQVQSQAKDDPAWYINRYKSRFSGYVLYDPIADPKSLNIATSIAGVTNAIMVDSNTLVYATNAGLPQVADARNLTDAQVYSQYGSQFNKNMIANQDTSFDFQLRDYAIMNKAFTFWQPPAMNTYLANQNHQGRVYGWGPNEYNLFLQASQRNQMVVASNYSWSSSTTAAWKVPLAKQQTHTSPNVPTKPGTHYVAFVMSDGDNVQWLTNGFPTDPKWFGSRYRGNFNMTWDLSPTLAEMNPVAMNYLYQHASNAAHKDYFVTAGGLGTAFPSQYPDIDGLKSATVQGMKTVDQNIISVLDTTYNKTKLGVLLDDPQVLGMMYKTYDTAYKGRNGRIDWVDGKPIVSVQYSLWDGYDTAYSIASALNTSTHRDPMHDQASYTIINVHPWSVLGPDGTGSGDPMSNLNWLVQHLNSNINVVTLEELMISLRNNFGTPVPEPSAIVLLGAGAISLLAYVWRPKQAA